MTLADSQDPSDAVLADWLAAYRAGNRIQCDALLRENPQFAAAIADFAGDYESIDARFAPLRRLTEITPQCAAEVATLGTDDTAVPKPKAGSTFGDYELLCEIARGGMGVVFKARQKSLNRIVALKMVLAGSRTSSVDRDRFLVEARAVARLNHPHIVPIYEVGEQQGQPYFTMEFLSGGSLRERVGELRGDQRAIARTMITVARAVEHAHRRGILHRDLKPSNVLLDERGEPHVTDFGLAKRLDEESDLTQAGAIVGTPSYMAPEQANAQTDLSTAVDVYGLGAVLYELLTGRPPFKGNTPMETMIQAVSREPQRPRKTSTVIDNDMETICLKCLEKDALARYGSAEALADDLERWLGGKPIHARAVTTRERLVKWTRRQPLLAGSLATVAAAVLALLCLAGFLWQNAEARAQAVTDLGKAKTDLAHVDAQRQEAETKKTEAEKLADKIKADVDQLRQAASVAQEQLKIAQRDAHRTLYAADMQLAHAAWQSENIVTVGELLDRYRKPGGQEDPRGFEWHYLNRQLHGARLSWHVNPERAKNFDVVLGMAISPDHKFLATAQPGNEVKLWSLADGKLIRTVSAIAYDRNGAPQANVMNVFFTDQGRQLVAVARKDFDSAELEKLSAEARDGKGTFRFESLIESLEFRTWTLAEEGPARVEPFDPAKLQTGVSTLLVGGFFAADGKSLLNVTAFDRSPDGKFLALAASDTSHGGGDVKRPWEGFQQGGRLIIWDLEKKKIHAQQKSPVMITAVAFPPSGQAMITDAIAVATADGAVGIGKLDLAQPPRLMLGHHGLVYTLRFTGDGRRLASGASDGLVLLWDIAAGKEIDRLRGHAAAISWLELTADGQTVASASSDGTIKVWDMARPTRPLVLRGHDWMVSALAFSEDGRELVSVETGGDAKTWNVTDGKQLRALPRPKAGTQGIVFISARGTTLAWPTWNLGDNRIVLRTLADGVERDIQWKERAPLQTAISADERLLASADHQSGRIGMWNIADGRLLKELEGDKFVGGLSLTKDGKFLAVPGNGIVLWDTEAGTSRRILDKSEGTTAVAFSPDDKLLAAASKDKIRIWDLQANQLRMECRAPGQTIMHVAISPDGGRLATAGMTTGQLGVLKLWDTTIGREVLSASLPPAMVTAIALSPDGHRLAAALSPLDRAASIAGRRTPSEIHVWDATPIDNTHN